MFRLIVNNGRFTVIPVLLSLLIFALILFFSITRHVLELNFIDIFSVLTGTCALLLTAYQIIHSIAEQDKLETSNEITETRNLLLNEIHEVLDICKKEFDSQSAIANSVIRKINELTIEIRTHANSIGHDSSIKLSLKMQKELTDLRADIESLIRQEEIINRLDSIEISLFDSSKSSKKNYGFEARTD